jgi:ribosomal protein S18 acetylase RimI-like enzyme
MAVTPLDNPVWYALMGPHAHFAIGQGQARHYPREIAPFSAIEESTPAAYAALAADLADQTEARLFRPENERPPPGWETISARQIIQMVLDASQLADRVNAETEIVPLGPADVPEMVALVETARPGPFASRTIELGIYVGVRDDAEGRLIAMGGERFQLDHHIELSAIAVHPEARGQGLGAAITAYLARAVVARGQMPFLHVYPDNPAMALYARLGFRERARLWVLQRRPVRRLRQTTRTDI